MLALTDEAFARLCIGATRIAPHQRGRWLRKIAAEVEDPPSPTARRLRKYQARRKRGLRCYRLTLDEIDTEEMLLGSGTLAPADRDDHGKVEAALARFLALCIADHRNTFQSDEEIRHSIRTELRLFALRRSDGPPKPKRFRRK